MAFVSTGAGEILYDSPRKRIRLTVAKHRDELRMELLEWERDGDGFESYSLFGAWRHTVARVPCKRATQAALQRFYDDNLMAAKLAASLRVAELEKQAAS